MSTTNGGASGNAAGDGRISAPVMTNNVQVSLRVNVDVSGNVDVFTTRKQAPSLQFDQGRRDQQELSRQLEVERIKFGDFGQIRINNDRQVDLVNINLLFQNEVQQQVEGSLKYRGGYVDSHRIEANRQSGLGAGKTAKTAEQSAPNKPQ